MYDKCWITTQGGKQWSKLKFEYLETITTHGKVDEEINKPPYI